MNLSEYGVRFLFSCGYDMSGFTALSITFTKPDGTELVVTNPQVSVPTIDADVEVEGIVTAGGASILFPANEYAEYIFQNGDVDQVGTWSARVAYTDSSVHLTSDVATFVVSP